MAYNLSDRFPPPPKCCMLLDPGSYQTEGEAVKPNQVPFLARTPRKTSPAGTLWTEAIYNTVPPSNIPNCTSLKSRCPRFPYESFSKEDLEALLCRCGVQSECVCQAEDEETPEVLCQAKVRKRIFIGLAPKSTLGEGLSAPSKRDHGFEVQPDGRKKRLLDRVSDESPPFYDAKVYYSTDFYHGCKWSKWTSQRSMKSLEKWPGPADYCYVKQTTEYENCAEKFREYRRMNSKQLRFIEMVQMQNLLEGRPGPGSYSPELPKGTDIKVLGPKAERFQSSSIEQLPGPADHWVKRAFDLPEPPNVSCHAKLPEPSFFGVKAIRFKPRHEEGPSPASYNSIYRPCHFLHCPTAPFGSSSARFKEAPEIEDDDEELIAEDEPQKVENNSKAPCPTPTWEFKSKTIRIKPLKTILNEPSPADLPQSRTKVYRSSQLQFLAPFCSSDGRFQPWNDWMPVHGRVKTPGPCYYEWDKPKCYPAVARGPLQRSPRFPENQNSNPSPNKYKLGGGVESVLATHNQKLKENMEKQHKFKWEPPIEPRHLSFEEQETLLLKKSIALLDSNINEDKTEKSPSKSSSSNEEMQKTKLLRCFVYGQETPHCI